MKVINFLEWFKEIFTNKDDHRFSSKRLLQVAKGAGLYLTPFKPEMITELFEGWADNGDNEFCDCFKTGDFLVTLPFKNDSVFIKYDAQQGSNSFFIPNTLNDFISDCQRAGIELTWKPEIERKYFK